MRPDHGFIVPDWSVASPVRALATTRALPGVSAAPFDAFNLGTNSGDAIEAVEENRRRLVELARLPSPPRWLKQVHGVDVRRFGASSPDASPAEADASVTSTPGVVLAVLTADCLPVLFASRHGDEIAAAHAGWRGLAAGVLEATVAAMRSAPSELVAWLGPAAGPLRYEIGAEVRDAFVAGDPEAASCFVATRPEHFLIDLYALAHRRLAAAGVTAVFGGGLCTISDAARFYSYRRDGRTGRMASLVWLCEQP